MKISLVTPVKDEASTVEELVEGIGAQTRSPDEWIVVDGGSRDDTATLFEQSGRCQVLRAPGNIACGRNTGIRAASGEIIATIDAGCRPAPDWLERLVAPLEDCAARVAAGSTRARIETPFDAAQAALLDQFVLPGSWRTEALSARCLAFRKELWEEAPFPEWLDHGEDAWLLGQWARNGDPPVRVPAAVVEWRQRPSVSSFLGQHFRYMRGDGRAGMNSLRHLLRWGFYGFVVAALFLGSGTQVLGWLAVAAWLSYAALSATRLALVSGRHSLGFHLRSLLLIVVLLPLMDAAKMVGYVAGLLARLTGKGGAK